jgi:hypothetical protein
VCGEKDRKKEREGERREKERQGEGRCGSAMSVRALSARTLSFRQRVRGEQAEAASRDPGELVPVEERRAREPWLRTGVPGDPEQSRGGGEEQYGDRDAP